MFIRCDVKHTGGQTNYTFFSVAKASYSNFGYYQDDENHERDNSVESSKSNWIEELCDPLPCVVAKLSTDRT